MAFNLHHYQTNLVNQARKKLQKNKGVLIVSPAGSGKSVVIADVAKKATRNNKRVLFIVHRKELAEQIEETFKAHGVLMPLVVIETVGKVVNRLDDYPEFHLIITDETHHSRAASYLKIYNHFHKAYRLGFTASPWRMNGKGFSDIYDALVEGPTVEWLIQNGFLAPFDYYAPSLADLSQLKKSSSGDYSKKSMDSSLNKAIFGDVVKHYKDLAEGKQAILYAHSREYSRLLAQKFVQQGIEAVHVDSKTPERARETIMQRFKKGEIKVLCNVDLISEGFNVPDCEVVILLRPTASLVLHIQQSMRSMRYKPDKKAIIIDHVGNYEKHGLPDTPREWTIEDLTKEQKKQRDNDAPPITDCPHCFGVIPSGSNPCPLCKEEIEVESKELEEVDGELEKVDTVKFQANFTFVRKQREALKKGEENLETVEDYYFYARAKGYKESWIKFKHPDFKNLSWPQFYTQLKQIKGEMNQ